MTDRFLCRAILTAALFAAAAIRPALAQTPSTTSDQWTAVDALGRTLPTFAEAGPKRPDRTVGMFYFLWLGEHGNDGPFDITRILQKDPQATAKPDSPLWGPLSAPHHWGESVFGYYRSDDPYVLRKHAQMLADAGVDMVAFDVTNQLTYPRSWQALGTVWTQVRKEGGRTPQLAFLAPFWDPAGVVQTLYEDLYQPGRFRDLWFRWNGKPLILADPDLIRPERLAATQRVPGRLDRGRTVGQTFTAVRAFTAVGGSFPTYHSRDSAVTLSLYAGGRPGGGRLLARKRFLNVVDNATTLLELPKPLPAGAYYLEQSAPTGQIGWWSETGDVYAGGRAWADGQPERGDRSLYIRYGDAPPVSLVEHRPMDPKRAEQLAAEIKAFFTFRKPQPDYFTGPTGLGQWGWLEVAPQKPFGALPDGRPEQIPVGVAQNAVDGRLGALSSPRSHGRSFSGGAIPSRTDFTGRNFQEQWDRAHALNPAFVFVTGWNEWIAGRFGADAPFAGAGPVTFVDQFDHEHSRDIEPVVGGHTDSYYYQLVANVRRYKGVSPPPTPAPPVTRSLPLPPRNAADIRQWRVAGRGWRDDAFDTSRRNHPGWGTAAHGGSERYTNPAGVNDFVELRAAHDAANLYLYARTREPLRDLSRPGALNILLTPEGKGASWEGFSFVLNRRAGLQIGKGGIARLRLERRGADGKWAAVSDAVRCSVKGSEAFVAVPLRLLGLEGSKPVAVDVKWTAGIDWEADPLNLYRNGDTAPNGRFRYRYLGAPRRP
jgi:hypothetical protein